MCFSFFLFFDKTKTKQKMCYSNLMFYITQYYFILWVLSKNVLFKNTKIFKKRREKKIFLWFFDFFLGSKVKTRERDFTYTFLRIESLFCLFLCDIKHFLYSIFFQNFRFTYRSGYFTYRFHKNQWNYLMKN